MTATPDTVAGVIDVVVESLGIEDRAESLDASSELFGAIPELDSLAVVEILTSLEERFNITIEDDEFDGQIFDTVGSLADFVQDSLDQAAAG